MARDAVDIASHGDGYGGALPCPGRSSPVRPLARVPVCAGCTWLQRWSDLGPHRRPPAQHDGQRWRCDDRMPPLDDSPPLDALPDAASGLPSPVDGGGGVFST